MHKAHVKKSKSVQFSTYKKLGVCQQEVKSLSTRSQLLVDKKLDSCKTLIINANNFTQKDTFCIQISHISVPDFAYRQA